jgi:hypothetical protein
LAPRYQDLTISAAGGFNGDPGQSAIHRSTAKPSASISKEAFSRDGSAIYDREEWTLLTAMVRY